MKRIFTTLAALLALAISIPAIAQESEANPPASMDDMMEGLLGDAFKAEPLTAEQQDLVPKAELVVARIFPEGTYAKMMNETMKPIMDGIMGGIGEFPLTDIARLAGADEYEISNMGEGTLKEVTAIMDPAFGERMKAMQAVTIDMITKLMVQVEPSYRAGLSRAYAQRFSAAELTELDRFFSTPVGSHYAAESMLIYTDPQVMSAMKDMMPAMFEMMPQMMAEMEEVGASLPQPRKFEDLSSDEQSELSRLLGVKVEELEQNSTPATIEYVEDIEESAE